MKVWVCQWPNGAAPGSRSPFGALPRSRVSLVLVDVSSMKARRCGMARMIGWRLWIHTLRSLATSKRARSSASRVFFIGEPGLAQKPRQRRRVDLDAMPGVELGGELGHGDVGRFLDAS